MTQASLDILSRPWKERQRRAVTLLDQQSHAEEMLTFYLGLLELQAPLFRQALQADWHSLVQTPDEQEFPRLLLEHLPTQQLLFPFRQFLDDVTPIATEILAAVARRLRAGGDDIRVEVLGSFLTRSGLETQAASLHCEVPQLEFFPRAFLQPIAEAMAVQDSHPTGEWRSDSCPKCGWEPQVAMIRDESEIKGRRLLVCSLCATAWPFARLTCVNCGEASTENLVYHISESTPHIRVEECKTCRAYLKCVDLRTNGAAVPLVDDLASVELDLWSAEQDLWKIQRNVLGL